MRNDTVKAPEHMQDRASDGPAQVKGRSLTFRVLVYLTLAMLPLGLIAVLQSHQAVSNARETYRSTLAVQTRSAAAPEGEAIVRAFGIARGLVYAVPSLIQNPERCANTMARTVEEHPRITFAGFVEADQTTTCNSAGQVYDFSDNPDSDRVFEAGAADITFNPSGSASAQAVVIVSLPVRDEGSGDLLGFVSLSFPTRPLIEARAEAELDQAVTLVTFDNQGRILTSDTEPEALGSFLPQDIELADLVGEGQRVFTARSADGTVNDYAVAPIIPGQAYALGIWDTPNTLRAATGLVAGSIAFPLLMWLGSLLVAVWSLRRLAILPIAKLGLRMRAFADRRTMLQSNSLANAPRELQEIGASFEMMADKIVQDEAEMEDRVYEREVLLREVHHRVKNNLQLMSSIINMQLRQDVGEEAEDALRRVQGRLASLAKFHQDLYETSSLSQLRADQLLEDLARQMLAMSADPMRQIDLCLDLDQVVLPPDQASPLAMLVTEALTNALKYAGAPCGDPFYVALRMKRRIEGGESVILVEIENSVGPEGADTESNGLGTRLITAFASQLEAQLERIADERCFLVRLRFEWAPTAER